MAIFDRVRTAFNAFRNSPPEATELPYSTIVYDGDRRPPSRSRVFSYNERSIVSSIYARVAIDVSQILLRHAKVDDNDQYLEDIDSALNDCLKFEPNLDQGPSAFKQDIVFTMFDKGVAAIVPVDTTTDPKTNDIFDIITMRVGEVVTWHPQHVRLNVYNENVGKRQEVVLPKRAVAIVENPLYAVMNEPNSTLQRLIRKLSLLDAVDEQSSSGKLDLIIQLPYVIKSDARKQQAEQRRQDIEFQLKGSQYGIAYTDGTEKITQLNRPAENNLLTQVEYLTNLLYNQLGITEGIMNGTADEASMINYYNRTIEPIVAAIVEAMQRTFIGPKRTHLNERIKFFRDPFKLVPVKDIAEIADKFTRNEILTGNEMRGFIGIKPSKDPRADLLTNSNMPQPTNPSNPVTPERISQNGSGL